MLPRARMFAGVVKGMFAIDALLGAATHARSPGRAEPVRLEAPHRGRATRARRPALTAARRRAVPARHGPRRDCRGLPPDCEIGPCALEPPTHLGCADDAGSGAWRPRTVAVGGLARLARGCAGEVANRRGMRGALHHRASSRPASAGNLIRAGPRRRSRIFRSNSGTSGSRRCDSRAARPAPPPSQENPYVDSVQPSQPSAARRILR